MKEPAFLQKLKTKWGITSNWAFLKICLIFALTGMSAVQIRKIIFPFIGVTDATPIYLKIILWISILTPFYYVFLLAYGYLFGEFNFFYGMFKKTFGRFSKLFKSTK